MLLDGDPVDGVLAPIGFVLWFPFLGAACALGAVGTPGYGDEMLRVFEVIGVPFAPFCRPARSAAEVGVAQRHHVVSIEDPSLGDDGVAVRRQPFAGGHLAFPVSSEGDGGPAFGNQRLVAGVLAVVVGVGPVFPGFRLLTGDGMPTPLRHEMMTTCE